MSMGRGILVEFGFCSLYGKDDRGISNFFKEANNRDVLGLRPMNNRISEILFPECTTLMPNLVYIYYLNAISVSPIRNLLMSDHHPL